MPRAAKKAAHQHNSRHENGVVAPGKRITKQKSNGNLHGSSDGSAQSHPPTVQSPSAAPPVNRLANHMANGSPSGSKTTNAGAGSNRKYISDTSGDQSEDLELMGNGTAHSNGLLEQSHRKIDVNSAKSPAVHDSSIFSLSLTILRSCPLGDTIAILIFLLSLPPSLLTVTNALFAVLTFMPPAGSFSSLPTTFSEVFQGSGGTPSLATIFVTDILGIVIWLVVWAPLQALGLELAQAIVATTLGGGNSNKNGGPDNTLLCMLIVLLTHIAKRNWIPKRIFGYNLSMSLASVSYNPQNYSSDSAEEDSPPRSAGSWFRVLVALHILIQGLVHAARRWYAKREYPQGTIASKRLDPETGTTAPLRTDPASALLHPPAGSAETTLKLSLTSPRDARERASSGKKRRKQGNSVRSQQPLWAAFAATKVTILREMEQSHAMSEAVGSKATDTKNLGSAPFVTEEGRIWITHVQPNSFFFDASYFYTTNDIEGCLAAGGTFPNAGVDRSKPFYVRVNGADWTSSKIERVGDRAPQDESAAEQWTGEVFGLSPSSSYNCSFVRNEDGVVIHSAIVSTPSSPAVERESFGMISPAQSSLRPSSPTTPSTTLKKSIAAFEASLSESQARQKRGKKDHKGAAAALKKEIDTLNSKIAKLGNDEKTHSSRHLQWTQNFKQADEALASISNEIDSMGSVPEDEMEQWKAKKTSWDEQRNQQDIAREEYLRCKAAAHQEKMAAQAEASSTQQKRDRLQARKAKLNDQHERLQTANSQDLSEKERKEAEQIAKANERRQIEESTHEQMAIISRTTQETQYHTQQLLQQVEALATASQRTQSLSISNDNDSTFLESDLAGVAPQAPIPAALGQRFPAFGSSDPAMLNNGVGSFRQDNRPRSTSLLSGSTSYGDFLDQDPAPPMPSNQMMRLFRGRQQSGSSGSGSNGSQRDPASPVSMIGNRMSPIVKKGSPVWN